MRRNEQRATDLAHCEIVPVLAECNRKTIHFPDDFLPHIAMWRNKGFANLEVTHEGAR